MFVKAVRGFPDHEKVVEMNLRALGNMAAGYPYYGGPLLRYSGPSTNRSVAAHIAEAGGIELAIEAMKKHPGVAGVQNQGCFVLYWMVDLKLAHPKIIKGKEQLEYAKSTYPKNAKIQKYYK